MTKKFTARRKESIFEENIDLIKIIYTYGGGLMLRQQLLILARALTGKPEQEIQKDIYTLINAGFIRQERIFQGCINKAYALKGYPISCLTGQSSKNAMPCNCSQHNKIYLTMRTEVIIRNAKKLDYINISPFLVKKNNEVELYKWVKIKLDTKSEFDWDYAVASGLEKRISIPGMQDYDTFSLKSLLHNNFLIWGITGESKKKIDIIHLNSADVSPNKFYKTLKCILFMLSKYTDQTFEEINIHIMFFNKNETDIFKKKWEKEYGAKNKIAHNRLLRFNIANACRLHYHNLALDYKYHLFRDL